MLINERTQHAVGQGFFHSALLAEVETTDLAQKKEQQVRYVYDCGAQAPHQRALRRAIDDVVAQEPGTHFDLLFLSHLHADHVNGVAHLLKRTTVDTVVMPAIDVVERLVIFARSVSNGAAPRGLHRELAIDPISAMTAFSPRQIILIQRGNDEQANGNRARPEGDGPMDKQGRWKIVAGATEGTFERKLSSGSTVRVYTLNDTASIVVCMASDSWLLKPYVHEASFDKARFVKTLAATLGLSEATLQKNLRSVDYRTQLVTDHVSALQSAYGAPKRDLNRTSLCLYSGPDAFGTVQHNRTRHCAYAGNREFRLADDRLAWLATGDANLRSAACLETFLAHFGRLIDGVGTLTVPHHGSKLNSDSKLYEAFKSPLCVVAADAYRNWEHPAAAVCQAVASAGGLLSIVTSAHNTTLAEKILVG